MEKFNKIVTDPVAKLIRRLIAKIRNFVEPINKLRKRKRNEEEYESVEVVQVASAGDASAVSEAHADDATAVSESHVGDATAVEESYAGDAPALDEYPQTNQVPPAVFEPQQPQVFVLSSPIHQGPPRKKKKVETKIIPPALPSTPVPFKDRRERFQRRTPNCCSEYPQKHTKAYLNVFAIITIDQQSDRASERQLEDLYLGIISSKEMPKVNDFYIKSNVACERRKFNQKIKITSRTLKTIENFHTHLFQEVLKIAEGKHFKPEEARGMKILVVPVKEIGHDFEIDFQFRQLTLSSADYIKMNHIPEIIHRLEALLTAEELREEISSSAITGCIETAKEITWKKIHFHKTSEEKSLDVISDNTKIIRFLKTIMNQHGPSPFSILHAVTLKMASEKYNMERLEILGDAFLEYITAIKCFFENREESHGSLAIKCTSKVSNVNLYEKAKEKNLHTFLIKDSFNGNTFIPPLYVNNKTAEFIDLPCKFIADMVESLIGLYIIKYGQHGGLIIMTWIGLEPIPNKITNEILKEDIIHYPGVFNIPVYPNIGHSIIIENTIKQLESKLHYTFLEKFWLLKAITHYTYTQEEYIYDNKQLSFIGQRVLYYIITRILYQNKNTLSSGNISKLRANLIKSRYHGYLAIKFQFIEHLLYTNAPIESYLQDCKEKDDYKYFEENGFLPNLLESSGGGGIAIFADLFRSVAAAIYLDSKSLDQVWTIYHEMMKPALDYFKMY